MANLDTLNNDTPDLEGVVGTTSDSLSFLGLCAHTLLPSLTQLQCRSEVQQDTLSEVQAVAEEEKFEGTWPQVSLPWIAGVRYAVPSKQGLAYCMSCG